MVVPLATAIGDLPSGPPPAGSTVSLAAARRLQGIAGWQRNARVSQHEDSEVASSEM
jgi:hypothetical protein